MPYQNLDTPYTRLNPQGCALLVIDAQNDFGHPEGACPAPGLDQAIPRLAEAIEIFREAARPVVRVVRLYAEDGGNVDTCRRWHFERGELRAVVPGTWGSELVDSTNPTGERLDAAALLAGETQALTDGEFVIYKPGFNAFHATSLQALLDSLGVDSVVLAGITFPNCVRATQFGACDRGYRVGLVPEACTEVWEEGLEAMRRVGVQLMGLGDLRTLLLPA